MLLVELLKLFNKPKSIFAPIPVFTVSLYLIANDIRNPNLLSLIYALLLTYPSIWASIFWNHTNDMEFDRGYSDNILTRGILKKEHAIAISVFLYLLSLIIALSLSSLNPLIPLFFIIWALFTWIYSDRIFFGKFFRRLKDDWRGELLTYSIAYPCYTMSIYLIMDDELRRALAVAVPMLFLGLSGLLLKDIKDITEDREAGLRTLGVVFSPSFLLRHSSHFLILYYLSIFLFTFLGTFSPLTFILIIPFAVFLWKSYFHFSKKSWRIEEGDLPAVQIMSFTTFSSLPLWGLANFIP